MNTPKWRLLLDDVGDSAWNMAVDRAIQIEHAKGNVPSTVRLYRWSQPTVTIGRFQSQLDVNVAVCTHYNVAIVRRFTGGRGVLHDDEVTYSIIAGVADGIPRGVTASYRVFASALLGVYKILGVDAELTSRPRAHCASPACYLHATHADLSVGSAKLAGSAQVWHGQTVLQHGSFTRTRDIARESEVFNLEKADAARLRQTTVTLADLLDNPPSLAEITNAAVTGFAVGLGVVLEPGVLKRAEIRTAQELIDTIEVK